MGSNELIVKYNMAMLDLCEFGFIIVDSSELANYIKDNNDKVSVVNRGEYYVITEVNGNANIQQGVL